MPGSLFVGNLFIVRNIEEAAAVLKILSTRNNILLSKVCTMDGRIIGMDTFQEVLAPVLKAGMPLVLLLETLYDVQDLPEGAIT